MFVVVEHDEIKEDMTTACSAAKSFAVSLLESRTCVSIDVGIPLTREVIGDSRYEPVSEE